MSVVASEQIAGNFYRSLVEHVEHLSQALQEGAGLNHLSPPNQPALLERPDRSGWAWIGMRPFKAVDPLPGSNPASQRNVRLFAAGVCLQTLSDQCCVPNFEPSWCHRRQTGRQVL